MTSAIKYIALALGLAILPGTAMATGGLDCSIDDANLNFDFDALFNYAGNSPLFQIGGNLESKNPRTYGALKKFPIEVENLKQQWFYGKALNLQFHEETRGEDVPFASVSLAIVTTQLPDDELRYAGTYTLTIQPEVKADGADEDPFDLSGKVTCSAG